MSTPQTTAPVRAEVLVDAPVERAFEAFTRRFDAWWPRAYKIGPTAMREAVLEPREGGRWFERDEDGSECEWGRVLVYEPPHRLLLAWQIDGAWQFDPSVETEVEVRFYADGETRTRVEVEHRHLDRLGEGAEPMQAIFSSPNGWPGLLGRLAEAARTAA